MNRTIFIISALLFSCGIANAQAQENTGLPPDPFAGIKDQKAVPDYAVKVDRTRGKFSIDAKDGEYVPGSHFAHWNFKTKSKRWGNYYVALRYESVKPKMGVQIKIGDVATLKSYAPRSGSNAEKMQMKSLIVGTAYFPKPGDYPVTLLTGDLSNEAGFFVKGIDFIPAPENKSIGQSIDGVVELLAKSATTYAKMMRYEPKKEKNCLGYWIDADDWAEWKFDINRPGKFKVEVVQGCGDGNGGSEVAVLINDKTVKFKVEETGGFQKWKSREIGVVELDVPGENKLAIKPLNKANKAVMDIQKIVLTPVSE